LEQKKLLLDERARAVNRQIEALWRAGEVTWEAFDWWLRWICGV
jgi:hypothetical protein